MVPGVEATVTWHHLAAGPLVGQRRRITRVNSVGMWFHTALMDGSTTESLLEWPRAWEVEFTPTGFVALRHQDGEVHPTMAYDVHL